jgi:hypothetical protein
MNYREYINSDAWKETRARKLREKRNRCEFCGHTSPRNHVHHLTYARLGVELMTDLMVLCREDHMRVHRLMDERQIGIREATHLVRMEVRPTRTSKAERKAAKKRRAVEKMNDAVDEMIRAALASGGMITADFFNGMPYCGQAWTRFKGCHPKLVAPKPPKPPKAPKVTKVRAPKEERRARRDKMLFERNLKSSIYGRSCYETK